MQYIIVDLEATCWENTRHPLEMEIIEIGALRMTSADSPAANEFSAFIKPIIVLQLTDFCKELTTITQDDVDNAEYFWTVFPKFVEWIGTRPFTLCSWGAYDLNQFRKDCERHKMELPATFENHINLKKEFARIEQCKPMGMNAALEKMNIPLQGTHHRGIDDARNIAKLARHILPHLRNGLPGS